MARKKKADIGSINITSSNSAFEGVQFKLDTEIDTSQIGSEVSKAVQVGIENGTKEAIKKISTKPTSSKTQKITKDAGLESKISSLNENISHFGTQIDKLTSEFRSFRKDFSKSNSNKSTSKSVKTSTKLVKTLTKPSEEYKISSSFIKQVVKDALADERRVINSGITSINSKDIKRGFYDVEESPDYYNKLSVRAQKYDHKRLKKFYEEEIAPSRFNDIKDLSLKSYEDLPVVKQNFKKLQEKYAEERKAQISYQESLVKAPFSGTPLAHPYHRAYIEEQRNKAVWNYTGGYINPFHESPELKLTAQQRSFDTFKETIQKEQEDLANLIADMREARQRARDSEDYIKSEADRLKEVKQKKEVDEEEVAVAKQKIKEEKEQAKQAKQQQKDQEKQQKRFSKGILSFLPGGGGMNNVLRMLGAGNPVLSGLFVVGQGILNALNKIFPFFEILTDLFSVFIYSALAPFTKNSASSQIKENILKDPTNALKYDLGSGSLLGATNHMTKPQLESLVKNDPRFEKLKKQHGFNIAYNQMVNDIAYGRLGSQDILSTVGQEFGGITMTSALGSIGTKDIRGNWKTISPHAPGKFGHLGGTGRVYDLVAEKGHSNTELGQYFLSGAGNRFVRGGHVIFNGVKYNVDEKGNISSQSKVKGHYDHVDVMFGEQAYEKYKQEEMKVLKEQAQTDKEKNTVQIDGNKASDKKAETIGSISLGDSDVTGTRTFSSTFQAYDIIGSFA